MYKFQVLKGMPDRPVVALVRLREIKYKIDKKVSAHDKLKNIISVKDVVKVLDGPWKVRSLSFVFYMHKQMYLLIK